MPVPTPRRASAMLAAALAACVLLIACAGQSEPGVILPGRWPLEVEQELYDDLSVGGFLLPPMALCVMGEIQAQITLDEFEAYESTFGKTPENPVYSSLIALGFKNCLEVQGQLRRS